MPTGIKITSIWLADRFYDIILSNQMLLLSPESIQVSDDFDDNLPNSPDCTCKYCDGDGGKQWKNAYKKIKIGKLKGKSTLPINL